MVEIEGPIMLKPNEKGIIDLSAPENKDFFEKLEKADINMKLPFVAENFKSSKSIPQAFEMADGEPLTVNKLSPTKEKPIVDEVKEIVAENKMLDNYLDQNSRTVKKALKEDDFDKETLEELYTVEEKGKNRKTILTALKQLLGRE